MRKVKLTVEQRAQMGVELQAEMERTLASLSANVSQLSDEEQGAILRRSKEIADIVAAVGMDVDTKLIVERVRQIQQKRALHPTPVIASTGKDGDGPTILLPPSLIFDGLLKRILPPETYRRYIRPHISDMHEEYFRCISNNDTGGARWAIIRAHVYVIPSWIWAVLMKMLIRALGKKIS